MVSSGVPLTSLHPFQWVEEADQQVHEQGQVKANVAPDRHVPGAPVQHRLGWRGEEKQHKPKVTGQHKKDPAELKPNVLHEP